MAHPVAQAVAVVFQAVDNLRIQAVQHLHRGKEMPVVRLVVVVVVALVGAVVVLVVLVVLESVVLQQEMVAQVSHRQ